LAIKAVTPVAEFLLSVLAVPSIFVLDLVSDTVLFSLEFSPELVSVELEERLASAARFLKTIFWICCWQSSIQDFFELSQKNPILSSFIRSRGGIEIDI
jgi:hypothetical protein